MEKTHAKLAVWLYGDNSGFPLLLVKVEGTISNEIYIFCAMSIVKLVKCLHAFIFWFLFPLTCKCCVDLLVFFFFRFVWFFSVSYAN